MIHKDSQSVPFASLAIDTSRVLIAMGYGNAIPDAPIIRRIEEMLEEAAEHSEASYYFCIGKGDLDNDTIRIGSTLFETGRTITRSLSGSDHFAVFAATAGLRFQQWMDSFSDPDYLLDRFIADSIGTEVAEATAGSMQQVVARWVSLNKTAHTNRFSPGYCGWPVQEQHKLFALIENDYCSITLTASSLMYPIKSVSGIIGIGPRVRQTDYSCKHCNYHHCFRRKEK